MNASQRRSAARRLRRSRAAGDPSCASAQPHRVGHEAGQAFVADRYTSRPGGRSARRRPRRLEDERRARKSPTRCAGARVVRRRPAAKASLLPMPLEAHAGQRILAAEILRLHAHRAARCWRFHRRGRKALMPLVTTPPCLAGRGDDRAAGAHTEGIRRCARWADARSACSPPRPAPDAWPPRRTGCDRSSSG